MGGISMKYNIQKVQEYNLESTQNILSIQINQKSSMLLLQIQNRNINKIELFQFKAGLIKFISDLNIKFEVKCICFKIQTKFFIFSLNEQNQGIFIKSLDQLNSGKYLMKLKNPYYNQTIYQCLLMNQKEDLIISGGINHITIWEYKNIQKIKQIITVQGLILSINLNPSETILISVVQPSYRYFIHIYEFSIQKTWTHKQCIEVGFNIRENICFLQDDIFIANTIGQKIVDVLFEYQNDVIEFYKTNKNGLFQIQKQQYAGNEWIQTSNCYNNQYSTSRKLIFCQFKSIIAGYSHKCIKFIKIQDQAKFTMKQIIKFDEKFKNIEFSSNLKYFFITIGNLIKIFEFNQIQ